MIKLSTVDFYSDESDSDCRINGDLDHLEPVPFVHSFFMIVVGR